MLLLIGSWLVGLCFQNLRLKNCLDRKKRKLSVCLLNVHITVKETNWIAAFWLYISWVLHGPATSTLRLFSSNFPRVAITRETHAYHQTIVIFSLLSIDLQKSRYRGGGGGRPFWSLWCNLPNMVFLCFSMFLFSNSKVKTKPKKRHVLFLRTCSRLLSNQWKERRQSNKKTLLL